MNKPWLNVSEMMKGVGERGVSASASESSECVPRVRASHKPRKKCVQVQQMAVKALSSNKRY